MSDVFVKGDCWKADTRCGTTIGAGQRKGRQRAMGQFVRYVQVIACGWALLGASSQDVCRAEAPASPGKIQLIPPSGSHVAGMAGDVEDGGRAVTGLVLTFVDSVWVHAVEVRVEGAASAGGVIAVESLSAGDTAWFVELADNIDSDAWVGISASEDAVTIFTVSSRGVRELGRVSVAGSAAFTGAWAAYVDAEGFVQSVPRSAGLVNFPVRLALPWSDSQEATLADGREVETAKLRDRARGSDDGVLAVHEDGQFDEDDDGGAVSPAAAYCCEGGGICVLYGGGCPSGTTQVSCPCLANRL